MNKEHVTEVVIGINSSNYSEHYKHDLKVCLKKFYKVIKKCEHEYPEEVAWINTSIKNQYAKKLPEELLTAEDINMLIQAAPRIRDKALSLYLQSQEHDAQNSEV